MCVVGGGAYMLHVRACELSPFSFTRCYLVVFISATVQNCSCTKSLSCPGLDSTTHAPEPHIPGLRSGSLNKGGLAGGNR